MTPTRRIGWAIDGGYPRSWSNTAGPLGVVVVVPGTDVGRLAGVRGTPGASGGPAPTIFRVRSSTISKLASFWSQKSSTSFLRRAGLVGGGVDDLAGAGLARLDHLGALHHPLGAGAGLVEDVLALALHLGEVLLALLQQPPGGAQLVGQALDGLVEQVEHLVAVDHHRRRQRHRPGRRHQVVEAPEHVLDVGARACAGARLGAPRRGRARRVRSGRTSGSVLLVRGAWPPPAGPCWTRRRRSGRCRGCTSTRWPSWPTPTAGTGCARRRR